MRLALLLVATMLTSNSAFTSAGVDSADVVTIGALMTDTNRSLVVPFRSGVGGAGRHSSSNRLKVLVERVPSSSFDVATEVCHMLGIGVAAIVGPSVEPAASHVRSICVSKAVPHISTTWRHQKGKETFSVNLYPDADTLSRAYCDVLKTLRWTKMYVIYEDNDSLVRLQHVLKMPDLNNKLSMTVRQLPSDKNYRRLLKAVLNSGGTHIVIDCSTETIVTVLNQAQQIGMVTRYYHYFFTNLDLHTVDLRNFQYAGTNITGLRLVPNDENLRRTVESWQVEEEKENRLLDLRASKLTTEAALLYDAALLFTKAFNELDDAQEIRVTGLSCDENDKSWAGESLINFMREIQVDGLSGRVQFNNGVRSNFRLDVVSLMEEGLMNMAFWSPAGVSVNGSDAKTHRLPSIKHQHLSVTTLMKHPYTMLKQSSETLKGNDRYEGLCIDLIHELARALDFNYTIQPSPDNEPGKIDEKTGRWNGMIGELLEGRADLAIADLTITSEREAVVDFTMQFMNLGISILFRKPTRQPPKLFSFLSPLSWRVWLYMAAATMGVSLLMFVLARFTPYEWEPPHPCAPNQDELENIFNFQNCIWFCIGSLMQQGCDFLPKAVSTRLVAGIWWFFTLIMISSYTANLAAFLTVERMVSPIESADDLAAQSSIKYGMYRKGSTATFFRTSKIAPYNKMWQAMQSAQQNVFLDMDAGIQRVLNGREDEGSAYAYFMESSTIEYTVEQECELSQVGGLLDSKGYGIALPPGSPHRDRLSSAILLIQEKGIIQKMYTRWWKERRLRDDVCKKSMLFPVDSPWTSQLNQQMLNMQEQGQLAAFKKRWWERVGSNCADDGGGQTASALDLENVGGVFVCLMGGMVVATLIATGEFVWHVRKQKAEHHTSVLHEMWHELRFILRCRGNTKPAHNGDDMEASRSQVQSQSSDSAAPGRSAGDLT